MRPNAIALFRPAACLIAAYTLVCSPTQANADDPPEIEDLFEYIETIDAATTGVPQGISSLGSVSAVDFDSLMLETDGKTTTIVNDELLARFPDEQDLQDAILSSKLQFLLNNLLFGGVTDFFRTDTVGNSDPFLARRIEVRNPLDEVVTFRFEAALEMVPLDFTATAQGRFSAEVFDTGGDLGAELTFNSAYTLRQADSLEELSIPLQHSGTVNDSDLSTLDVGPVGSFAISPEDFDRMLSSVFLTLSPGDTAVITTIGTFGDSTTSLIPLSEIEAALASGIEFADSIPEPNAIGLFVVGGVMAASRLRRQLGAVR
ncbi:MAG: hypothetical protein AAGB00_04880 [Planctomycetota bacterium]